MLTFCVFTRKETERVGDGMRWRLGRNRSRRSVVHRIKGQLRCRVLLLIDRKKIDETFFKIKRQERCPVRAALALRDHAHR